MKIGIYGGTFNPIHLGHMAAAKFAAEYLKLDKLYLVPAGIPPHKALQEDAAGHLHRLEMTRLAADALELSLIHIYKLRRIISENKDADFLLWNGNRPQIKRILFEKYIDRCEAV